MRILALATDAYGGYGGIARYNRDLAEALAARHDVGRVEILPRLAPRREPLPARVRQAAPRHGRARYALAAAAAVARLRPSVILNAHLYHAPLAARLAHASGAALVSVLHGSEIWSGVPPRLLAPLARSARVLCASRDTEARILALCPALEGRTAVTFNTVGDSFRPGDRAAARRRYGVEDTFTVLTVARLDPRPGPDGPGYKGHERIVRHLATLPVGRPVTYLVAGDGGDRARIERVAREAGVAARVRFLGKVPDAELPALYRAADLFALPSTGEGFGIVYLEAMASGVPAIGLAVGGAAEALGVHPHGIAAAPADFPAAFARAAASATTLDDNARARLAAAVRARYGPAAFRRRVDAALEGLPHTAPGRRSASAAQAYSGAPATVRP